MSTEQRDVVIVGAGFAGLRMLHRVLSLGLSAVVLERGGGIGGTWFWNKYPGARCDVDSMTYSYSFEDVEQEWDWSEKYAQQPEILRYIDHVADRFHLRPHVRLNSTVTSAVYDESAAMWTVTAEDDYQARGRYCVLATGSLSIPKFPEVEGIEDFQGEWSHTATWPDRPIELSGKRVAVVGTGSSGVQTIPVVAELAANLTVFQRTPNFSLPANHRPLTPEERAERKANYPQEREANRNSVFGLGFPLPTRTALSVPDEERYAAYESQWGDSLFGSFMLYADSLTDVDANKDLAEFLRAKIGAKIEDPKVRELLVPTDHYVGTKRPCMDSQYYETFNRPDVQLVDLRATPIVRVTPNGILTAEQEYEFDVIIYATGFDALAGAIQRIDVRGRDGQSVAAKWADGPRTYLGIGMSGFPNLFMMAGPQSPSVLSNVVVSIEYHTEWIGDLIAFAEEWGLSRVEPTDEAEDGWVAHIQELADGTLWPQTDSWYVGANVPGKPRVMPIYTGGVITYHMHCDQVAADGYPGFVLELARVGAGATKAQR